MKNIKPNMSYLNLEKYKDIIYKENNLKSGIYRWVNLINGSTYVGSSINLSRRFRDYFSERWLKKESLKNNSIIYKALLKNNCKNFKLEILQYIDFPVGLSTEEKRKIILEREQYYLDILKPNYNICEKAGSTLGRVTLNSTRLKLKNAWLIRLFGEKVTYFFDQITFSEFVLTWFEKKVKRSEVRISKLERIFEKISENKTPIKKPYEVRMKILFSTVTAINVLVTDISSGVTTSYPSARSAAIALNCSHSTVMNKLKGKNAKIYKGRYIISK